VLTDGKAFDRDYLVIADQADLRAARAFGDSVDEHGARAALAFATAVFGAGQVELVAQDGEQGPLGVSVDLVKDTVYFYLRDYCHENSVSQGDI